MFRAIEKVVGLALPPNLIFLRRTIVIYVSLILLVIVASPALLLLILIPGAGSFAIFGVIALALGAALFIQPFVGSFALFIGSLLLARLLIGEMELLSSTRRVTVKAKNIITRNRALRLTVSLVLSALPLALIPISVGISLLALNAFNSGPVEVSELLYRYGREILIWTAVALFLDGFIIFAALFAVFVTTKKRTRPKEYNAVKLSTFQTVYLPIQTEETARGDAPASEMSTSETMLQAAIVLMTFTCIVGFSGVILMALSVQSALWSNVLLYGLFSVFAGVGLLALAVLSARRWRQRTPSSASEVSG